jgi:hypothetical protein
MTPKSAKNKAPRDAATAEAVLHYNLPLIQVADKLLLDTLLVDRELARYIVFRLSDREALALPDHVNEIIARLIKLGHLPKVHRGPEPR